MLWALCGTVVPPVRAGHDFSAGVRAIGRLTKPREVDGKTVKWINFFEPGESALLYSIRKIPGLTSLGIRRADLLPDLRSVLQLTRLSQQFRRLLDIGVIKRINGDPPLLSHHGSVPTAADGIFTQKVARVQAMRD